MLFRVSNNRLVSPLGEALCFLVSNNSNVVPLGGRSMFCLAFFPASAHALSDCHTPLMFLTLDIDIWSSQAAKPTGLVSDEF